MRFKFCLFFLFTICLISKSSEAAFVRYVDRQGKFHYVNTDYAKIPDEYLDQVKDQLEKIQNQQQKDNNSPKTTYPENNSVNVPQPQEKNFNIEVYVKSDCKECERLETTLQANQINYQRFDVEFSSQGKEFYKSMPNADLPVIRINGKVLDKNNLGELFANIPNRHTTEMPEPNAGSQ